MRVPLDDRKIRLGVLVAMTLVLACASRPSLEAAVSAFGTARGFTLVDLHPDDERSRLYAVNFQQAGLIPVCSEVEYVGLGRKAFEFRVVSTDRVYTYFNHKAAAEPFVDHLKRFFGPSCPRAEIDSLSATDRQGIREGRAIVGMTRRGVILAMGYPPRHVNPNLDAPSFTYWKNRFNRVRIHFGPDGRVSSIED